MLALSQAELTKLVRVNKTAIKRLEGGTPDVRLSTLKRVRATLVVCGVVFVNESNFVGVRLLRLPRELEGILTTVCA